MFVWRGKESVTFSEAEKELKEGKVVPRRRERLQLKQQGGTSRGPFGAGESPRGPWISQRGVF